MNPPPQTFAKPTALRPQNDEPPQATEPERWPPPRPAVIEALLRNWFLVVLPAVALAAAGVALAYSRPPTYTAEARLSVGKANPTSPAFGGFVDAVSGLAAVYSRAINAPGVTNPIANSLHWSSGLVSARLSATPIQDSPIIRVIGKAPSAGAAEVVANAGARQLSSYVTTSNRSNPDAGRLMSEYHTVALQKAKVDSQLADDTKALDHNPGSAARKRAVARDTASHNALSVRLQALSGEYIQSQAGQATTQVLSPLSTARSASSDRSSQVQTKGGVGLLAGLVIGVALAMWRANRQMRRRLFG
jgi:capsular polysaccharide biosynthesis protein